MKNCNTSENQTPRRILPIACATALAAALTFALPQPVHADRVTLPPLPISIPDILQVPEGNKLFLVGHALVGTQNYICRPSGTGVKYILFTPQATLFSEDGGQVITHYFSPDRAPNPLDPTTLLDPNKDPTVVADGAIRATWQHRDTSIVWAKVHKDVNGVNAAVTVDKNAVAWLLLDMAGVLDGPTGGDTLTKTTFVQRLNTSGGLAPDDCTSPSDIGKQAFVPYTADYLFYTQAD